MEESYRILDSAHKHGITEQEIHYALSDNNPTRRSYILHDDEDGNAQDMYVFHTGTRPWAIEVGVSYRPSENVVFQAAKVTPEFAILYEAER